MYDVVQTAANCQQLATSHRAPPAIEAMNKTSSFRGVTWSKRHAQWQAGISLQGRSVQCASAELPAAFPVLFATLSKSCRSPDVLLRQLFKNRM
jgi:hypothetical protein